MGAAKGIEKLTQKLSTLNFKLYKHGKERNIEVDAADIGKHYHCDLDGTGSNIVHGRVSALGGCGLHTAR